MSMKNKLSDYWRQKELERGRIITVAEVSRETGLHHNTVRKMLKDKTTRYDEPVLNKICAFFDVPPGPVPFIVYEP